MDTTTRYKLLKTLEENPALSQRELARELGMSLGKTNYCVRALMEKGWVKVDNFRRSQRKIRYVYNLTPSGVSARARITRSFLRRKIREYEQLEREIRELRQEVSKGDP